MFAPAIRRLQRPRLLLTRDLTTAGRSGNTRYSRTRARSRRAAAHDFRQASRRAPGAAKCGRKPEKDGSETGRPRLRMPGYGGFSQPLNAPVRAFAQNRPNAKQAIESRNKKMDDNSSIPLFA